MRTTSVTFNRPITQQPSLHSYTAVPIAEPDLPPARPACTAALPLTMIANASAETVGSPTMPSRAISWASRTPRRAVATALAGMVVVANASLIVSSLAFDCGTGNDHSARLEATDLLGQFNGQGPRSQWPPVKLKLD